MGPHSKLVLILLALMVVGCAEERKQITVGQPTNKYDVYLKQFNDDLIEIGHEPIDFSNLEIRSGDLTPLNASLRGVCYNSRSPQVIAITEHIDDLGASAVLYHEIGHCLLGLSHSNGSGLMEHHFTSSQAYVDFVTSKEKRLTLLRQMMATAN